MSVLQWLTTIIFFIVFIQLFIALSIYLWRSVYDFYKRKL